LRTLLLEPLSQEAFAPFGQVIDPAVECERLMINDGRTARFHALAIVDCGEARGQPIISVFRGEPVDADFVLTRLERHPLGSQAFLGVGQNPYAVVVAPPGPLREDAIRGFLAAPGQGVNYARGVWHHYLLPLYAPSEFFVVDRDGPGDNCEEQTLREPLTLALPV
jgi:ureidoglycolate lyase